MLKRNWDGAGFWAALSHCMAARGAQAKDVSKATGVSVSTLSRMKNNGRKPDAASLAALSAWSGLNAAQFVLQEPPEPPLPRFSPDALASSIREMVKADIQGDGERYTLHETAMRQQLYALERELGHKPLREVRFGSTVPHGVWGQDVGQSNCDGVAESPIEGRNGNADWTKAGTGANSPTSPGLISRKASTGSAGSNPAAVAPPPADPHDHHDLCPCVDPDAIRPKCDCATLDAAGIKRAYAPGVSASGAQTFSRQTPMEGP